VGEFSRGDTSIQVTGLKPGQFYSLRVIASNAASFSTLGPLIHLRTLPLHTKGNGAPITFHERAVADGEHMEAAGIRISSTHPEPTTSQPMTREHSGGHGQPRRAGSGRRNSPASLGAENVLAHTTATDGAEACSEDNSIEHLTARLDSLRHEQQELDKQILEEELDFKDSIANLLRERDQLKQTLKEREDASNELKKQGNLTFKQQKTAQNRKAQKERLLNERNAERKKTKEEISKWNQEIIDMRQDVEDMSREQANVTSSKDRAMADVRTAVAEDQAVIKTLEEDIRATGSRIKALQEDRERVFDGGEEESMLATQEKEDDQAWEAHAQSIQVHINTLIATLRQVSD
jgi:DNA repair exonuclease SbcCD ATPase subunit